MKFEPVGHSSAENAMLTELFSASDALHLSQYKEFLTHPCESERNEILDQAMEEAIHRVSGNRIRGLSVRHVDGQILVTGSANSYQTRQLVIDLVKNATGVTDHNEYSACIDLCVNGERPEIAYAGCPAATLVVSPKTETSNLSQPKLLGQWNPNQSRT